MANLNFLGPLVIGSIPGSIKRSPILKDSLCHCSPMQHWSVYLTMSHESKWHPSAWRRTVRFDSDFSPVRRRLGQYGRFSISAKGYVRENIENHELSERRIWHQSICLNSKHSREDENSVLFDDESFLCDIINSITLNETSTNVSDHVAGYIIIMS